MREPRKPQQVVVAYDFSPSATHALARAVAVALRAPEHVLHIVSAIDRSGPALDPPAHANLEDVERVRARVVEDIVAVFRGREAAAEVEFFVHVRIGKPSEEILSLARDVGADLVFVGSHGKSGVERFLLGSTSERVVREAHCPVIVAKPKTYEDVKLMKVIPDDHPHRPYHPPHRYAYVDTRVVMRPDLWPIP
ncbi:MAG: universal stress protein [Deltaproteobacteria bacterium]|nr:universal stress protein [Deltaproteobacteria bacterium]MCW5801024.1 universal stress protein [Deltaproteobacteria bacterium]